MARVVFKPTVPRRLLTVAAVLLLHLVVAFVLLHAFAPQAVSSLAQGALQSITVTPALQPRSPPVPPLPVKKHKPVSRRPQAAARSGAPAARASAAPLEAPSAPLPTATPSAAIVAGDGTQSQSGNAQAGQGTGAMGSGRGSGAGAAGEGSGGGGGRSPPIKIAGDINSARDYPRQSRDQRINSRVVIALTVGIDGRVKACRVLQPSPDVSAGPITCGLAMKRFRFRPAIDAQGRPVEAQFGWQQRWFY